jgi:L,D-peptidoglycan transpeptidase YkuD (ErfK/YbiS/YcfS/YnhG family)
MRQKTRSVIYARPRPGQRSRGLLLTGARVLPVMFGRSGIRADKREGDGATPRGRFRLVRLWWRADRWPRPRTLLPVLRIKPDLAWCEDSADRRYNRPFRRSANGRDRASGDRLWRDDHLYDFIIEIDHNARPRVAGRGSAVFLHLARPGRRPTAGCIAFEQADLLRLLAEVGPRTRIEVQL